MGKRVSWRIGICVAVGAMVWLGVLLLHASEKQAGSADQKGAVMSKHAQGTFDVKVTPQPADANSADPELGRMRSEKQIHGDLEATSQG